MWLITLSPNDTSSNFSYHKPGSSHWLMITSLFVNKKSAWKSHMFISNNVLLFQSFQFGSYEKIRCNIPAYTTTNTVTFFNGLLEYLYFILHLIINYNIVYNVWFIQLIWGDHSSIIPCHQTQKTTNYFSWICIFHWWFSVRKCEATGIPFYTGYLTPSSDHKGLHGNSEFKLCST